MTSPKELAKLLQLSRKQRSDFAKLPAEKKREVATRNLRHLGIIDSKGRLTQAFR